MADRKQCDQYAAEMARRFDEFTTWAIDHWPHSGQPLLPSDFDASRKELGAILGARLNDDQGSSPSTAEEPQYVQVNPAPWP
jgi:hypothetical protein